ncbi:DUF3397 family protein [Lapidilactobacillus mulanensis]|uniref:DUF3397 family protein n=1 Tax=Lapidilactobacillus mulanensis TaxID=2485999 RepID=A0ABW4DKU6_9LACO|nr:DUF3397 family protein [Lapidilactobacillus mulanensis]
MQTDYFVWSFLVLIIGVVVSVLLMTYLNRFMPTKWRLYDAWAPFITGAASLLAASHQIASTWAYILIDVCALALIFAIYTAVEQQALHFPHFFVVVWRSFLLISVGWYLFVVIWLVFI